MVENIAYCFIEEGNHGNRKEIDPSNTDSVRQATGVWIAKLGEIGSTMRKDMK